MVHMCHFISGTALNPEFDKRNMGPPRARAASAQDANVRNLVASHITEQMDVPGREGAADPRDVASSTRATSSSART